MKKWRKKGTTGLGNIKKAGGIHYEIMARCYNPNRIMYSKYGGRGIEVCEEWHDRETFKKWLYEQGFNGTQRLERIDATKDYSHENCRLGTKYKKKDKPPKPPKPPKEKEPSCVSKKREKDPIKSHPLYSRYKGMRLRCENPRVKDYKYYGARGISVCEEWRGRGGARRFIKWAEENGFKEGLTLDRIDNNGNYSPSNCRWITIEEQQNNRRGNILYEYNGEKQNVASIARSEGISYNKMWTLLHRLGLKGEKVK